jgi:N-acyl-phosphatidylethanolamine-hydrolysing phospholipase D
MKPVHINPAEAVQIHLDVRSRLSLASHWGVFPLTQEPLHQPPRLLKRALRDRAVSGDEFRILRIGETITTGG